MRNFSEQTLIEFPVMAYIACIGVGLAVAAWFAGLEDPYYLMILPGIIFIVFMFYIRDNFLKKQMILRYLERCLAKHRELLKLQDEDPDKFDFYAKRFWKVSALFNKAVAEDRVPDMGPEDC
jgi:hypothetical protein